MCMLDVLLIGVISTMAFVGIMVGFHSYKVFTRPQRKWTNKTKLQEIIDQKNRKDKTGVIKN